MANKLFTVMETSFEAFDKTIDTYLQKVFNKLGLQYSNSQIFSIIFNGIKGVMQNAMFYIEDAITEQNIETAIRKKSVYSLAKVSGYEPYYGTTATGTIYVYTAINSGLKSKATKIYITNRTKIVNKSTGLEYMIILNSNKYVIDIAAPLITHEFKIIEGSFKTANYVARGEALERVSVDVAGLFDREYFTVTVNGETWTQVASLYDMYKDSKTYILNVGYENTFDIIFGNGVYGKIPESGATITIEFLSHSGTNGNISLTDTPKFKFTELGYDSLNNQVDLNEFCDIVVKNVVSGGTQSDSIDFVRDMIGCNSRSNVLASEDNFRLFFKRFAFIGQVNCWSDTNSMIINAVCTSNIMSTIKEYDDYYKLQPKDLILSENYKAMILNTLNNTNKAWAGITLNFEDPAIRRFGIICYLKTSNVYSRSLVEEHIKNAIAAYFISLNDNTLFIPKSDIITAILNSDSEIISIDIDFISELAEECFKTGYYYTKELKLINEKYKYVQKKIFYEAETSPGLDNFGNIALGTNLEIPMICGGFKYYPNKEDMDKDTCVTTEAIQFLYI